MPDTPRINYVLLVLLALISAAVFGAALALPTFRPLAYAPVRELVLPPPEPVVVSLLYTTEKTDWLNEVIPEFEATHPQVNGHPVQIKATATGSRELTLAVLNGQAKP